jgi:hypothetical protein
VSATVRPFVMSCLTLVFPFSTFYRGALTSKNTKDTEHYPHG